MTELRKDSLSFMETIGQSVANVSPTLTPALSIAVVAGTAGTGSWFVFLLATIAMLVVGVNVGKLAQKSPPPVLLSFTSRAASDRPTAC